MLTHSWKRNLLLHHLFSSCGWNNLVLLLHSPAGGSRLVMVSCRFPKFSLVKTLNEHSSAPMLSVVTHAGSRCICFKSHWTLASVCGLLLDCCVVAACEIMCWICACLSGTLRGRSRRRWRNHLVGVVVTAADMSDVTVSTLWRRRDGIVSPFRAFLDPGCWQRVEPWVTWDVFWILCCCSTGMPVQTPSSNMTHVQQFGHLNGCSPAGEQYNVTWNSSLNGRLINGNEQANCSFPDYFSPKLQLFPVWAAVQDRRTSSNGPVFLFFPIKKLIGRRWIGW